MALNQVRHPHFDRWLGQLPVIVAAEIAALICHWHVVVVPVVSGAFLPALLVAPDADQHSLISVDEAGEHPHHIT